MLSYEEFEKLVTDLKDKLDETTGALVSEDILGVMSNYKNSVDKISELNETISTLQGEKEELLKANGRLFQKIGFEDPKEEAKEESKEEDLDIAIEDIIDEKGDLI